MSSWWDSTKNKGSGAGSGGSGGSAASAAAPAPKGATPKNSVPAGYNFKIAEIRQRGFSSQFNTEKQSGEAGLLSGTMNGCVSAILLYSKAIGPKARWQKMRGQHGAGGVGGINFKLLFEGIEPCLLNRLVIVTAGTPLNVARDACDDVRKVGQYDEIVEVYLNISNALVTIDGNVFPYTDEIKKYFAVRESPLGITV